MSHYPPSGMIGPRAIAWWAMRTLAGQVTVDGLENVPRSGPVLIAARHYHNLLDGATLITYISRPLHIVVGLDWTASPLQRGIMERLCAMAQFPVVIRPQTVAGRGSYSEHEVTTYARRGVGMAAQLLCERRAVVMFPEGYPAIDPTPGAKQPVRDGEGFLPFSRGVAMIARLASRAGCDAPIVPVGFTYERQGERWRIRSRIGEPLESTAGVAVVEARVRELSVCSSA